MVSPGRWRWKHLVAESVSLIRVIALSGGTGLGREMVQGRAKSIFRHGAHVWLSDNGEKNALKPKQEGRNIGEKMLPPGVGGGSVRHARTGGGGTTTRGMPTSYSILTMAELVEEPGDWKKLAMVSGRHVNSTTKFFARGSASCSTCEGEAVAQLSGHACRAYVFVRAKTALDQARGENLGRERR